MSRRGKVILSRHVGESQSVCIAVVRKYHVHTLPELVLLSLLPTANMSAAHTDDLPSSRLHDSCIMRLGEHKYRTPAKRWQSGRENSVVQDAVSVLVLISQRGMRSNARERLSSVVLHTYAHIHVFMFTFTLLLCHTIFTVYTRMIYT